MKVKEESEKVDLKLTIQKTKIMASGLISSVQFSRSVVSDSATPWITACQTSLSITNSRSLLWSHHFMANKWGNSERLYFGGSKITADGDCSHEINRCLLLGRKLMTNLDSILKSRDITLPTKVCLVKAMVFTVVMYGCESWTIRKSERWRIDAFELWYWRRLLRIPGTARRSNQVHPKGNQSWIFIGRTDVEAETPILWPPDVKNWLVWKDPDAGKDWRREDKGTTEDEMVEWHHQLNGHEFE